METQQTYWQILPLTTTGYGDSPYQSFSAIAGNTHLIDFALLAKQGLLNESDYNGVNFGDDPANIEYERIFYARRPILEIAVKNLLASKEHRTEFENFAKSNRTWLDDYAEFMAIKEHFGNHTLQKWDDKKAVERDAKTLEKYRVMLAEQINYFKVTQYFFFQQWLALKTYANKQGIKIIGDMPIYVAADSVEVWAMPELFQVDDARNPLFVAAYRRISSAKLDNFGAIRCMTGRRTKLKATRGGFIALKKVSTFMTCCVSITSKAFPIIGRLMAKRTSPNMAAGSRVRAMIYSKP